LFAENLFAAQGIELVNLSIKPVGLFDRTCPCVSNQQMALLSDKGPGFTEIVSQNSDRILVGQFDSIYGCLAEAGSFGTSFAAAKILHTDDAGLKQNGTKSYAKVQRHDRSTTKMLLNQLRQQRADFVAERSDIAICAAIA
jgi:hypothetical protein